MSFPLSQDESLANLECVILAKRVRSCWGLWNRGHPFSEIVDHLRDGDSYKVEVREQDEEFYKPYIVKELAPIVLARFIQELEMIHRGDVPGGRYNCTLEHVPSLRLVLRPAVPVFRGRSVSLHSKSSVSAKGSGAELGDFQRLINMAMDELGCEESRIGKKIGLEGAAEWLYDRFGPLDMPVSEKSEELVGDGEEGVFCSSIGENMGFWEGCIFATDAHESHLRMMGAGFVNSVNVVNAKQAYQARPGAPRFHFKAMHGDCPGAIRRLWTDSLQNWNGMRNSKGATRIKAALKAEEMQLLRRCYPVELVPPSEAGTTTGQHGYRLLLNEPHPIFGEIRRDDGWRLVDECFEEGISEFVVNSDPDPLNFKGSKFEIVGVKDGDPNLVIVKEKVLGAGKTPESGWLRANNIGTTVLHRRKSKFISESLGRKSLERILDDEWFSGYDSEDEAEAWRARHPGWRLDSSGQLQLVQGPPGTGKTWTATRLVEDLMRERPQSRILLCAKEHLALDHLTRSVIEAMDCEEFSAVRVARVVGGRKGEKGQFDEQISNARMGRVLVEELASSASRISDDSDYIDRVESVRDSMTQEGHGASWPGEFYAREAQVVCVTTTDEEMVRMLLEDGIGCFDYAIVEEAGKSYPSEIVPAIAVSRTCIPIGDQMQLPPYEIREIRNNLELMFSVDVKGLSGDKTLANILRESGYTHRGLSASEVSEDVGRWLEPFRRLYELSDDEMGGMSNTMLLEERRMFEGLSDIVGEVFYDGPFSWMKEGGIPEGKLPPPFSKNRLLLVDSPHCSRDGKWRESRSKSGSYCNKKEADLVTEAALELSSSKVQVVVLSPYQGQVDLIKRRLKKKASNVGVFTVDGFQGKEADFVLLSMVRNNDKTSGARWGFVSDPNRLNVALSRAREGLAVFTSMEHLKGSEFEEGEDHLPRALDLICERGARVTPEEMRGLMG